MRRALVLSAGFAAIAACAADPEASPSSAGAVTAAVDTITSLDRVPVPAIANSSIVDNAAAIRLGKALFWDVQTGSDGKQACASCHFAGGADTHALSQGVAAGAFVSTSPTGNAVDTCTWTGTARQHTTRNAPSSIGAVFYREQFWDGRATDPAAQSRLPIMSAVEMSCDGRTFAGLATKLLDRTPLALQTVAPTDSVLAGLTGTYRDLVEAAFGSAFDADRQFSEAWGQAIQAYESTLIPDQTPMDQFLRGKPGALTDSQRKGFGIFAGVRGTCITCHAGPELSDASWSFANEHGLVNVDRGDQGFHDTGVRPAGEDPGRASYSVSGAPADKGAFKTPALRNVKLTAPYFHDGSAATLKDVVDFYARGGDFHGSASQLHAIVFLPGEEDELLDFLTNALTDCRTEKERAPFDHPSLDVVDGPSLPAVGAEGTGSCGL